MRRYIKKENTALLRELVASDFKLRYQGSVLGYAWSLLRPLFMFAILYIVFALVFKAGKGVPHYPVYLLLGIVLWNFFTEMTQQSLGAIVARGQLIRKIRIPRWLIIVSTSISALINLALNLFVVVVFALINHLNFTSSVVLLPFYILEIYLLALGLSLILSAMYVRYRDIGYIWDLFIQAGFYATPILYPITTTSNMLSGHWGALKLMYLNPLAQAIQGARNSFVTKETLTIGEVWHSQYAVLMTLGIIGGFLLYGILYFKKRADSFAEDI